MPIEHTGAVVKLYNGYSYYPPRYGLFSKFECINYGAIAMAGEFNPKLYKLEPLVFYFGVFKQKITVPLLWQMSLTLNCINYSLFSKFECINYGAIAMAGEFNCIKYLDPKLQNTKNMPKLQNTKNIPKLYKIFKLSLAV